MPDILLFIATGMFTGVISGLLGVGGGLIIVPVLFFIFAAQGIPTVHLMHMALATSLATIIVTSISSARAHHKKHAVLWPMVLLLAPGIAVGAWSGGVIAARLDTSILKPFFAVFELLVAIHLLLDIKNKQHSNAINKINAGFGGLVIGCVSALVGIGGGTLTVPFLQWHNISIHNAVATSAACGLPIAIFASASYIVSGWHIDTLPEHTFGYVHITAFVFVALASFFTAPLGAKLAHRLPEQTLKKVFAVFLLLIGFKMLL